MLLDVDDEAAAAAGRPLPPGRAPDEVDPLEPAAPPVEGRFRFEAFGFAKKASGIATENEKGK